VLQAHIQILLQTPIHSLKKLESLSLLLQQSLLENLKLTLHQYPSLRLSPIPSLTLHPIQAQLNGLDHFLVYALLTHTASVRLSSMSHLSQCHTQQWSPILDLQPLQLLLEPTLALSLTIL